MRCSTEFCDECAKATGDVGKSKMTLLLTKFMGGLLGIIFFDLIMKISTKVISEGGFERRGVEAVAIWAIFMALRATKEAWMDKTHWSLCFLAAHCIVAVESAHSQIRGIAISTFQVVLVPTIVGEVGMERKIPLSKDFYNFLMDSAMSPIALEASGIC
ncbi:Bile acid Na+ symporter family protein [Corchorus olitorius]|uniref:Bile acid Na+ symporter family protein n=1 Tax=Corchorus olitorius TaxID=93759 RepID=A0A1R3IBB2_9ROSI|nr:Bile acid Na+ symporter family protein [Corchorus olitorius]